MPVRAVYRPWRSAVSSPLLCLTLLITAALTLSGCIRNGALRGPDTPKALQTGDYDNQEVLDEIARFYGGECIHYPTDHSSAPDVGCGSREEQRNAIIYDLKNIIDNNYESYSRHLRETSDTTTFMGEVGAASLTGVGTLVGAGGLKDILTTASTLTQSTNVSVQKNFYQKQTAYAILSEMDADRSKKWSTVVKLMKKREGKYPLSEALNDLQEYKRVGTFTAALTSMTRQAGLQDAAAKKETAKDREAQVSALTISVSHVGNLASRQNGVYSIIVSNNTEAATRGAVTVTENLSAGLTLVSMAGSGWTCTDNKCKRPDALAGGASYPVITVNVKVTAPVGTNLKNKATVTGGGSASSKATNEAISQR